MRMKKLSKKTLILAILAVAIAAVAILLIVSATGVSERTQFNSRSLMDWHLGSSIDSVKSAEDAHSYDTAHYKWFSDEKGEGLKVIGSDTKYYLSDALGGYKVTGFASSEENYSVMGIRVGSDELESKKLLMDAQYVVVGGGLNSCRAEKGCVTIELFFEHGSVTEISAFINK